MGASILSPVVGAIQALGFGEIAAGIAAGVVGGAGFAGAAGVEVSNGNGNVILCGYAGTFFWIFVKMGCPALEVWVAFMKQPALPGKAPQTKKKSIFFYLNKSKSLLKNQK
jgi:hypothetical protein